MIVGRSLSSWEATFSGKMLNFQGVPYFILKLMTSPMRIVLQPRFQMDEDDFTGTIFLLNRNVFELWNRHQCVTDGSDGSAKMSCFSYLMLFVSLETFEVA